MFKLLRNRRVVDGCRTVADVVERYKRLDRLITHLKSGGTPTPETGPRSVDGILIHLGKRGKLIFGGGGAHRLGIYQHFHIKVIPAQLGVIHRDLLTSDPVAWNSLRIRPQKEPLRGR